MSLKFGFGVENETTINFTDKNRVKRAMQAKDTIPDSVINLSSVYYHRNNASHNGTGKWQRANTRHPVVISGDVSVDGNARGHGFEVQTTPAHTTDKPRVLIEKLFVALNDMAKEVTGDQPNRIINPFGSSIGFSTKSVGSYHLNFTFPYDESKAQNAVYVKKYKEKTFRGLKVVRAIQPLFFALIGGADLKSVGTPTWAEGSSRQAYDSYSNLGNVALDDNFRRIWFGRASGDYKSGNRTAPFKNKLKYTVDGPSGGVNTGGWGDINPRHFGGNPATINSVEFRFLDPFFAPNVYEVVKVIVAAMDHGDNVGDITDGKTNTHWNKATQLIVEEGWNARLPKEYLQMLKSKLDLPITVKDGLRADIVFQEVAEALWKKNKSGSFCKTLFDEFATPKVLNLNRYNWDMQFRHRYVNEAGFTTYIDKLIGTLQKIDASKSGGWVNVAFDTSDKKTVRDIILDDTRYGMDMGTEDFEDIVFLLERIGAVKLKTNPTGHIVALKVMYSDPKEIMKKIDNLQTIEGVDETYFGEETEEVEEEVPVEPEPEPETEAAPTPGRRVSISTTDNVNIDMSMLHITHMRPEEDSDLDYNVRDFNGVFESANFIALDGSPYTVSVSAAKIKYGTRPLQSFWIRSGHIVKVYLDSTAFDIDESMVELVKKLKRGFFSPRSVERTTHFMPDLSITEFFAKLELIARNHYKSVRANNRNGKTIVLDAAGLETLKRHGLRIASLSRGQKYFIVNKYKQRLLKQRYGDRIQLIKYVPYQKKIYVQKLGNQFKLFMEGRLVDKIGGISQ